MLDNNQQDYHNHRYWYAHIPSSRLVNLANEELRKKGYHLEGW